MNNDEAKQAAIEWHGQAGGELLPVLTANELAGIVNDALRAAMAPPAAEACFCDATGLGVPGVSCGDCPRDYAPKPVQPATPVTDAEVDAALADCSLLSEVVTVAEMRSALSKFAASRALPAPASEPVAGAVIGMRDASYKDSTPRLHVGSSAFEDWFQDQPFATQVGIKQISRDSYAAGMGDPLVTYASPQGAPASLSRSEIDALVYQARVAGDDSTYAVVNAALKYAAQGAPAQPAGVSDVERIDALQLHSNWELSYDGYEDESWVVHKVTGGRNDREWSEIGQGETVRAAIDAAILASRATTPTEGS